MKVIVIVLLQAVQFFYFNCYSQGSRYNEGYALACHNCFETQYARNIVDVFPYTTTIELDIWDSRLLSGGWKTMNRDWYVKHSPLTKGNDNCCGGSLTDCLKRINAWSDANPNHSVITIFIDKKENWSEQNETRNPKDLDELLLSVFKSYKIYTPSQLLKNEKTLKDAARKGNWTTIDALRGKFIFVITNGTLITKRDVINEYLNQVKHNSICFVAPEITNESEISKPNGIGVENALHIVFYNLQYKYFGLSEKLASLGLATRLYGSPETLEVYNELISKKVNFVAFNNYKILGPKP